MTAFLLNSIASVGLVAQTPAVHDRQLLLSREAIRRAVITTLAAPVERPQADWARVMGLSANDSITVVAGATPVSGRFVSADQSGLTLRDSSGNTSTFARTSIQEVRRTTRKRGSKLGAVIGAGAAGFLGVGLAIGLATRECGDSCTDEKVGVGVSLIGLPIAGGFAGYYLWPPRTSVEVVYTRPML